MPAHPVDEILCPACHTALPASADRCTACGAATVAVRQSPAFRTSETAKRPLLDRPWVILGLLFLVMAVLGLPVLWKSRAFSRPMKVLLSLVVTLYTILLVAIVGAICYWAYESWMEVLGS